MKQTGDVGYVDERRAYYGWGDGVEFPERRALRRRFGLVWKILVFVSRRGRVGRG